MWHLNPMTDIACVIEEKYASNILHPLDVFSTSTDFMHSTSANKLPVLKGIVYTIIRSCITNSYPLFELNKRPVEYICFPILLQNNRKNLIICY